MTTGIRVSYPWAIEKAMVENIGEYLGQLPPQSQEFYNQLEAMIIEAENGGIGQETFETMLESLLEQAAMGLFTDTADREPTDNELAILQMRIDDIRNRIRPLSDDIYSGRYKPAPEGAGHAVEPRIFAWAASLAIFAILGSMFSGGYNDLLMWVYQEGKDHCNQCRELHGTILNRKQWLDFAILGIYPRSWELECKGLHCGCQLVLVVEDAEGRYWVNDEEVWPDF